MAQAAKKDKASVTCNCCSGEAFKFGSYRNKNRSVQRYRCPKCAETFSESQPLDGVRIDEEKAHQAIHMLCEGVGIRAASRLTGLNKSTILNILESAGQHCAEFLDSSLRGLKTEQVQVDEVYAFVYCKQMNTTPEDKMRGDQYTYLSIDRDSKLIINWMVGKRSGENCDTFMADLKSRIDGRFQLSTDGFMGYTGHLGAVFQTFRHEIDYGAEIKHFAPDSSARGVRRRDNPVKCQWVKRIKWVGNPDPDFINTSHVERVNLTARLFNRRLTRCTLGYSKTVTNLRHSTALFIAFYNFCRVHHSLKQTPAMAHKLTDHVWTIKELLAASCP